MTKIFLLTLLSLAITVSADAALITWGSATDVNTLDPTQVLNTGIRHAAATFTSAPLTVNNVSFATSVGYVPSVSPTVTFTDLNIRLQNLIPINSGITQDQGPNDTDYAKLVSSGPYNGNSDSPGYWEISNLTLGQQYQVQLWTCYQNQNYSTRFSSDSAFTSDASPFLNIGLTDVNNVTTLPPQFVIGTFTANAATQNIYFEGNNGFSVFGPISVSAVPEPSTWALTFVAGVGLFCFRKIRRATATNKW